MLILALAIMQPVEAQSFKPDFDAAVKANKKMDYATALRHYRPLAEQGHASAQNRLGNMYSFGIGLTRDYKQALKWYRLSAKQGYLYAQASLGHMYRNGFGVTRDYKQAVGWYRKAANQGAHFAQRPLGEMYRDGKGVLQDLVMSYVWLNVAATEDTGAMASKHSDIRDNVLSRLTAPERKLALKLSKLCLKKPAKCPEYSDD